MGFLFTRLLVICNGEHELSKNRKWVNEDSETAGVMQLYTLMCLGHTEENWALYCRYSNTNPDFPTC